MSELEGRTQMIMERVQLLQATGINIVLSVAQSLPFFFNGL